MAPGPPAQQPQDSVSTILAGGQLGDPCHFPGWGRLVRPCYLMFLCVTFSSSLGFLLTISGDYLSWVPAGRGPHPGHIQLLPPAGSSLCSPSPLPSVGELASAAVLGKRAWGSRPELRYAVAVDEVDLPLCSCEAGPQGQVSVDGGPSGPSCVGAHLQNTGGFHIC